jgi:hypothetical protein
VAASSPAVHRRAPARTRPWTRIGIVGLLLIGLVVVLPLVFAGSPTHLASGTRIAGVDVGGLTPHQAQSLLEARARQLERVPISFVAGGHRFRLSARELGVQADWGAAVATAKKQGGGIGLVRGFRRLSLEFFPQDVVPQVQAYEAGLDYELGLITKAVDRPRRDATLVRRGLHVTIAPGAAGLSLDPVGAREVIVRALASFSRTPRNGAPRRSSPRLCA